MIENIKFWSFNLKFEIKRLYTGLKINIRVDCKDERLFNQSQIHIEVLGGKVLIHKAVNNTECPNGRKRAAEGNTET
jgi:hypothetical protein